MNIILWKTKSFVVQFQINFSLLLEKSGFVDDAYVNKNWRDMYPPRIYRVRIPSLVTSQHAYSACSLKCSVCWPNRWELRSSVSDSDWGSRMNHCLAMDMIVIVISNNENTISVGNRNRWKSFYRISSHQVLEGDSSPVVHRRHSIRFQSNRCCRHAFRYSSDPCSWMWEKQRIYLSTNLIKTAHSFNGCITIFIMILAEQLFTEKIHFEDTEKLYKDHLVGSAKRAPTESCRRFFNRLAAQAKAPPWRNRTSLSPAKAPMA